MTIKLDMTLTDDETILTLDNKQGEIMITETLPKKAPEHALFLLFNQHVLIGIATNKTDISKIPFHHVAILSLPWDIEPTHLGQLFSNHTHEQKKPLKVTLTETDIPSNSLPTVTVYKDKITCILERIGYYITDKPEEPKKPKPGKARHRWSKEVSQIEFFIDSRESTATVMWQKRNEMLIKSGATMKKVAPLNKDGSVGFSAKMGDKIRSDHASSFKDFTTTEDIILKSVNEVGLFLYYAGTNSWLEMSDKDGKTINEWTVVE